MTQRKCLNCLLLTLAGGDCLMSLINSAEAGTTVPFGDGLSRTLCKPTWACTATAAATPRAQPPRASATGCNGKAEVQDVELSGSAVLQRCA